MNKAKKILVTGTAGFIGNHLALRLLARGDEVYGVDNLNNYYDVYLKEARLKRLEGKPGFQFSKISIEDKPALEKVFSSFKPEYVIHLAAQAGVRYSLTHPQAYIDSNIQGFLNVIEGCRHHQVKHLTYASSSSVYGLNRKLPFSIHDNVDHPVSLYAATKKANELMAHTYSHLFRLPTTGLRFFTVYGPWGRPDMSLFLFTKKILAGEPIEVFNHGNHKRDFTFIDDIVEGVIRTSDRIATPDANFDASNPDPGLSSAPYRVYNIGNHDSVPLMDFIAAIEEATERKAQKKFVDMQPGDVPETFADVEDLKRDCGFAPRTSFREGVRKFVEWYKEFYGQ